MPRGKHHHHEVKSESDLERVWVSLDDEGNELGYHVEPAGTAASVPLAEHLGTGTFASQVIPSDPRPTSVGPVRVNHRLFRQTVIGFASGLAGAGLIEAIIHYLGV